MTDETITTKGIAAHGASRLPSVEVASKGAFRNDGVVQGLSEVPFMQQVKRWGVLTIGTDLGNARFTNRNGKDGLMPATD